MATNDNKDYTTPLLDNNTNIEETNGNSFIEGVVNYRGEKVIDRSKYGGWKSAWFIIVVEIAQTFTYFGITSNLISYLTGPLRQSTAVAAANINAWVGAMWMLPLLVAFIADSYLGHFRTIIFSSVIYILGLALLTLSAVLPSLKPPTCTNGIDNNNACASPTSFQIIFFFSSLYLVAIGNAGYKPCAPAFGADQFDERDPNECRSKSSFFNWWNFGISFGGIVSFLVLNYIQDNFSWGLGFGIPCIFIIVALLVLLAGTKTYRYRLKENKDNPFVTITRVFIAAAKNWRLTYSSATIIEEEEEEIGISSYSRPIDTHQFRFLEKALVNTSSDQNGSDRHNLPFTINQVEDAKAVLRLVPIWLTCLVYGVVVAQPLTFFVKQASTMDRSIGLNIQIPAASIQIFTNLSFSVFIVIYDRIFVPLARVSTGKPNGIQLLQRIGGGFLLSSISMAIAAIVEKRRLQVALDYGLTDIPEATIPMSVWWLVPQYVFVGLTSVFGMVGLQEFFYDQVPRGLRTMGISIYFSLFGIGSFISSLLISVIDKLTSRGGRHSWFDNNLNRAHLDYFYWLLAGLSILQFGFYMYFTKSYLYNNRTM